MSNTLMCTDTIQRVGHTIINGTKVVQHVCTISLPNPKDMRVSMIKLNPEMYREYRDVCRADFADFEDAAYQLQDECLARVAE